MRTGSVSGLDLGRVYGLCELGACWFHERGVEGSAYAQREGPLRTCGLHGLACPFYGVLLARDDHLSVAVVVGRDDQALGIGAYLLDGSGVEPYDRRHEAGTGLAALLHLYGTRGDEPEGVLEAYGSAGDESRELSEGVPSDHVGPGQAFAAKGGAHGVQEYRGLRDPGRAQVFGAASEHYVGDAEAEYLVGLLHHLPCLAAGFI